MLTAEQLCIFSSSCHSVVLHFLDICACSCCPTSCFLSIFLRKVSFLPPPGPPFFFFLVPMSRITAANKPGGCPHARMQLALARRSQASSYSNPPYPSSGYEPLPLSQALPILLAVTGLDRPISRGHGTHHDIQMITLPYPVRQLCMCSKAL